MSLDFSVTTGSTALGAGTPSRAVSITLTGSGTLGETASFALSVLADGNGGTSGVFYPPSPVTIASGQTTGAVTQFVYIPPLGGAGTVQLQVTATGGITTTHTLSLPIGTATTITRDSWTGSAATSLSSHVGETGATWTLVPASGGDLALTGSGRIYGTGSASNTVFYYASGVPATAEYDISAAITVLSRGDSTIGLFLHSHNPGISYGGYRFTYRGDQIEAAVYTPTSVLFVVPDSTISTGAVLTQSIRNMLGTQYVFHMVNGVPYSGHSPIQNSDITTAYFPGIYFEALNAPTTSNGVQLQSYAATNADWVSASATTYTSSLSGSSGPVGTAVVATVTPNVPYTGTITLTPSGAGLSTPQVLTFSGSDVPQMASFTPTASGTLTITGTNNGSLTNPSADTYSVLNLILVNNAGLYFSQNWYISGSSYASTTNPGAYLKTTFTGTSATLLIDGTLLTGFSPSHTPTIAWSIDGAKPATQNLSNAGGTQSITLGSSLAAGSHDLVLWLKSTDVNAANRWNETSNPYSAVNVTGLVLDSGATVSVTPLAKKLIVFGDSITEAFDNLGADFGQDDQDGIQSFGIFLGQQLGAESAVVGYASQGYLVTGNGGVPTFDNASTESSTTWDKFSHGVSRLSGGAFLYTPDYILVAIGLNDASQPSSIQSLVVDTLTRLRAAAPNAWIFHMQPFYAGLDGGAYATQARNRRAEILAGATAYAGTATTTTLDDGSNYTVFATDKKAAVLDTGPGFSLGFSYGAYGSGLRWSYESIHPSAEGHAQAAARLGNLARLAMGGGGHLVLLSGGYLDTGTRGWIPPVFG